MEIISVKSGMDYQKQIDRIIELAEQVKPHCVTILTGKNGSGKSVLRKLVATRLAEKLGTDPNRTVASVSMESRTQPKHDFSALKSMAIDDPEAPTGAESVKNLDYMLKYVDSDQKRYIVIDEPEIGMGEELVAGLALRIIKRFTPLPTGCLGVMIITHNRHMVKALQVLNPEFMNIEDMSLIEWLNREIIPTDIEEFEHDSLELWRAINQRVKDSKEQKKNTNQQTS